MTASDPEGHEIIMRVIEAGAPFAEICFCSKEKGLRHTTGRAVVASEVLEIKHRDFVNYLQGSGKMLTAFLFTFCERLSEMERRVEVLAHRGADDRSGRLPLHLAAAPGEEEGEVMLHVNHDELARMAAMSRPHVTVTMGKFRRQRIVRYGRNRPLMVNVPLLKSYLHASGTNRREHDPLPSSPR